MRPGTDTEALCAQTESGQGYDLDRSLFERLVRASFPVATLEQQRRMRPSISRLIRKTIYPSLQVSPAPRSACVRSRHSVVCCTASWCCCPVHTCWWTHCSIHGLHGPCGHPWVHCMMHAHFFCTSGHQKNSQCLTQDHASVTDYPKVKGMLHNVFFWDHNHPEGGKDENSSKQNSTEAAMAARLALYLTQQGYKAGDITILTPYVGQLLLLRAEVQKYMRFVVSERDEEELAAAHVTSLPPLLHLDKCLISQVQALYVLSHNVTACQRRLARSLPATSADFCLHCHCQNITMSCCLSVTQVLLCMQQGEGEDSKGSGDKAGSSSSSGVKGKLLGMALRQHNCSHAHTPSCHVHSAGTVTLYNRPVAQMLFCSQIQHQRVQVTSRHSGRRQALSTQYSDYTVLML